MKDGKYRESRKTGREAAFHEFERAQEDWAEEAQVYGPVEPKKEEKTPKDQGDKVTYTLKKPIEDGENEYKELIFDFDSLTGFDVEMAISSLPPEQQSAGVIELNKLYLAEICAIAAGVRPEVIKKLSAKDYSTVTTKAMSFLIG